MGIACKPMGKFRGLIRKTENKLEEEKKMQKNKKRMANKFYLMNWNRYNYWSK